jgi:hypothetical protein
VPPVKTKKAKDKISTIKQGILDVFETSTPAEQDRLHRWWNGIPNVQDLDLVLEEARTARKNAKPFRVK